MIKPASASGGLGREASGPKARGWGALKYLLISMRPKQWTKNGLVFMALVFSVNLYWQPLNFSELFRFLALPFAAFVIFCLISASEYLFNDILDLEKDRQHPKKGSRPLASGKLSPRLAASAAGALLLVGLPLSFLLTPYFGLVALTYVLLMAAYSLFLKRWVIIDVFTIAAGFVLRAMAGAVVISVPISPWLYLCTMLGALFLGFTKRRHELVLLEGDASQHRDVLREYTPQLLDEMIAVVTSSTVVAYSVYTFSAENLPKNHAMMLTIPFVLYGIFRYLYLVHAKNQGGSPEEVLLSDMPLIIDIILWLASAGVVLIVFR